MLSNLSYANSIILVVNTVIITKFYQSKTSLPGGCLIGARPVNIHLAALKKLGMNYEIKDGYIFAKYP